MMKRPVLASLATGLALLLVVTFAKTVYSQLAPRAPTGTPIFISSGDSEAGQGNGVAFDASGSIMTVWEETDKVSTKSYHGKVNGKLNDTSKSEVWGATTEIVIPPKTEPVGTYVLSLGLEHMLAFWTARDRRKDVPGGWPYAVWSASYTNGQWSAAVPVSKSAPGMSSNQEQIAVAASKDAASGKAIAVWQERGCTGSCTENTSVKLSRIMSATYSAASGWSTPIQINDSSTPLPEAPQVSIDQQGRAIAVWTQFYDITGTKVLQKEEGLRIKRLHYSVLQPGSSRWAKPLLVAGVESTADMSQARVSSNAAGDALVAWAQKKGRKDTDKQENCEVVMATRLVKTDSSKPDLSWETPKPLSKPAGDFACNIVSFSMALDAAGNALVGWTASVQPERDHVAYAAAGQAWRAQLPLPYSDMGSTSQLRIAFVSPGRAVVVGTYAKHGQDRRSRRSHIVKHHFEADKMDVKAPAQAWSASQLIDWPEGQGLSAQQPTLAVHPSGQGISTWRQAARSGNGIHAYTWTIDK